MGFTCPLCREEWIITKGLCPDCDRIRFLMSIYDKKIILDILDRCLVIQKFQENEDYYKDPVSNKWIKKEPVEKNKE